MAVEQKQREAIRRWMKLGVPGNHIRGSLRLQDSTAHREHELAVLCSYEEMVVSSSALLALCSATMVKAACSTRRRKARAMFAGLQNNILKDSIHKEAEFIVCWEDGEGSKMGAVPLFMHDDGQTVMIDIEVLWIGFPELKICRTPKNKKSNGK
jgi:hypothetical protein